MTAPSEYTLVEKPILDTLTGQYGYRYIHPGEHEDLRTRENEVLFKPLLIDALVRINGIPKSTAQAVFNDLAGVADNQKCRRTYDSVMDLWRQRDPAPTLGSYLDGHLFQDA